MWLQKLTVKKFWGECRIKDVSALVEAKLNFNMRNRYDSDEEEGACEKYQDIVRDILESVHHVKKLNVGNWCHMVSFP